MHLPSDFFYMAIFVNRRLRAERVRILGHSGERPGTNRRKILEFGAEPGPCALCKVIKDGMTALHSWGTGR